jgi:uncharacterized protein YciW
MEQRRFSGKSHWYHETQSSLCPADILPLVPEAAGVADPFYLDLAEACEQSAPWLNAARSLAHQLLPENLETSRLNTLSCYDRLSTALTVAQVYGVQRLCNHYAARLAPQPGPDSSRESNHRLTQITQYARQLASHPTLIDSRARQQLAGVGLSDIDIIHFHLIIGFVGFQARAVAAAQALAGFDVRWLPGMEMQQPAAAEHFSHTGDSWRSELCRNAPGTLSERLEPQRLPLRLRPLAPLFIWDNSSQADLLTLSRYFDAGTPETLLCTLLSARINGSVICFNAAARRWVMDKTLPDAMRNGERALQAWGHNHPRESAVIQALQLLIRSPGNFGHGAIQPLRTQGISDADINHLLLCCALCGWFDRMMVGLGEWE